MIRRVRLSLAFIAVVMAIAIANLPLQENWPKIVRVGSAFSAYAGVLWLVTRARERRSADARVSLGWFVVAAAVGGLVSGLLQPIFRESVLIVGALGAGMLFGTVHWMALRRWEAIVPS